MGRRRPPPRWESMCSYCGCEAEPLITALMADHAVLADLAYQARHALDGGDPSRGAPLIVAIAERFRLHSLKEEEGLFAELAGAGAGEASLELERLRGEHDRLREALGTQDLIYDVERCRDTLGELLAHAETEDDDLFPYALQLLPSDSWDRINDTAADA
ncbi:MAG TPA: hemerythrin domain-containing protein [Acidimicrobiales bacterium]|nr:hemerythrin domain-containing protein [Acidimicrobiales bacterium]